MERRNVTCLLCGSPTAPGYLVPTNTNSPVAEFHGRHKNMYGVSVRRTQVEARMCTCCGYVMSFAIDPTALDIEIGKG